MRSFMRKSLTERWSAINLNLRRSGGDAFGENGLLRGVLLLFFGGLDELSAVVLKEGFRRLLVDLLDRTLADEMVLSLNL